jgi:phage head maturation protease
MDLDGAADAYEVSLVAVPAQPGAGIIKSKRYGGQEPETNQKDVKTLARARLALEKIRFGGTK